MLFAVPAAFLVMNILGFALMGEDKRRAVKGMWRIPEAALFAAAFLLGGVGSLVGMFAFRHKTKHAKFLVLMPLLAIWSVAAAAAAEYFVFAAVC